MKSLKCYWKSPSVKAEFSFRRVGQPGWTTELVVVCRSNSFCVETRGAVWLQVTFHSSDCFGRKAVLDYVRMWERLALHPRVAAGMLSMTSCPTGVVWLVLWKLPGAVSGVFTAVFVADFMKNMSSLILNRQKF